MSTPTSQLPTRQQLDEIDSLLRRMLSLPPLATDAPATDMPPPRVVEYSPPGHSSPVIRETTPPSSVSNDPVVQSWRVSWPTIAAQAQAQAQAAAAAPSSGSVTAWGSPVAPVSHAAPQPMPAPSVIPPAVATPNQPLSYGSFFPLPADAARPGTSVPGTSGVEDAPPTPIVFLPLTILNGVFDIVTYLFGPLGAWMRYDGRKMLGWMGILMVTGAIGWGIGEWRGVDWPKPDWAKLNFSRSDWRPDWLK